MAPKYKYELEDKVWVIPTQEIGIIKDIRGNKYEIYISRLVSAAHENKFCMDLWEEGYITCMAHELLPYTEGMELLYE
jgi:hypothetical protein